MAQKLVERPEEAAKNVKKKIQRENSCAGDMGDRRRGVEVVSTQKGFCQRQDLSSVLVGKEEASTKCISLPNPSVISLL